MAVVFTDSQNYTDIASAIRIKLGVSDTYKPGEMAPAIMSIPINPPISNQDKTASPSISLQTITFDQGYTGLGTVTINPVTSSIDNNITSDNIKSGITILGVTGSLISLNGTQSTVTPTESIQTIVPAAPYNAFDSVTVNAIPSSYIIPTGTSAIALNGTYNISSYANVSVDVPDHPYAKRYTSNANFTSFTDSSITTIPYGTFAYTLNLASVSFEAATTIGSYAFGYCFKLQDIYFPNAKTISAYAFQYCSSFNWLLDSTTFPKLSGTLGAYAFRGCQYLTGVSLPNITSCGAQAFSACSRISFVNLPLITNTSGGTFSYLTTCVSYSLPTLKVVGSSTFYSNWALSTLTLPAVTTISAYAFRYCSTLMSLYLPGSTIPTLAVTAFANMPMSVSVGDVYGSIFVPSSMLTSYQAAAGWKSYSARIVAIPEE